MDLVGWEKICNGSFWRSWSILAQSEGRGPQKQLVRTLQISFHSIHPQISFDINYYNEHFLENGMISYTIVT